MGRLDGLVQTQESGSPDRGGQLKLQDGVVTTGALESYRPGSITH